MQKNCGFFFKIKQYVVLLPKDLKDYQAQRNFRKAFNIERPSISFQETFSGYRHMKYKEKGSVLHQKDTGRSGTSQENVEHVLEAALCRLNH